MHRMSGISIYDTNRKGMCSFMKNSAVGVEAWRQRIQSHRLHLLKSNRNNSSSNSRKIQTKRLQPQENQNLWNLSPFVLPCSRISKYKHKKGIHNQAGTHRHWILIFDVGEGGALDAGNSFIHIQFPDEFELPKKFDRKGKYILC
ncbi:MAG: hypothetical protein R2883_01490 [Caldisericia bacterium]